MGSFQRSFSSIVLSICGGTSIDIVARSAMSRSMEAARSSERWCPKTCWRAARFLTEFLGCPCGARRIVGPRPGSKAGAGGSDPGLSSRYRPRGGRRADHRLREPGAPPGIAVRHPAPGGGVPNGPIVLLGGGRQFLRAPGAGADDPSVGGTSGRAPGEARGDDEVDDRAVDSVRKPPRHFILTAFCCSSTPDHCTQKGLCGAQACRQCRCDCLKHVIGSARDVKPGESQQQPADLSEGILTRHIALPLKTFDVHIKAFTLDAKAGLGPSEVKVGRDPFLCRYLKLAFVGRERRACQQPVEEDLQVTMRACLALVAGFQELLEAPHSGASAPAVFDEGLPQIGDGYAALAKSMVERHLETDGT